MLPCRGPREHAANSLGLERPGPEPLELPRWPREDDDDHGAEIEHEARCRSGEPERLRAIRPRRLLAHARREVHVRPPEPVRDRSRDRADLFLEHAVENQLLPGDTRDELDRPVVVGRPQAARDEAEIGIESLPERVLEVLGAISDDRDRRRFQPQAHRLGGEKRSIAVLPLASDELGAGDDDRRARAAQEVARVILCDVTRKVVPRGRSTRLPFSLTTTFCGLASASCRLRPSNDLCWPRSSVPL